MVLSHGRNWMCTSAGSVTTMWSSSVLHSANVWPVHDLIVSCFRGPVMPTRLFRSVRCWSTISDEHGCVLDCFLNVLIVVFSLTVSFPRAKNV
uniref:Uncharacterized protein n=1 Tax=Setaria italica TaxID=4555 RepID=K3ZYH1_SETIT